MMQKAINRSTSASGIAVAGPAAAAKNAWWVLAALCSSVVLSMTTWFSATAVSPELKTAWSLSDAAVAWLTNGVQIGFVSGALIASLINLPDIVRLNRLLAGASLVAALANLLLLTEPGPFGAILCRVMTGIALASVYPPALKLVSTWFIKNRGLALGAIIGALTLGSSTPHLFRSIAQTVDWRLIIALSSACALVGAVSFLFFAKEGPYPFGRAVFSPRQIFQVVRDRDLFLVNVGYLGHMWELYAMWTWLLVFVRSSPVVAQSPLNASMITFIAIAVGVIGCLFGGVLSDRFGRTATTAGFMAVSGLCALAVGFAHSGPLWLLVAICIVWGVAIIGDSAQFSTAVTELCNRDLIGTALSLQMGLGFALTVFIIWLMPQIAEIFGSWRWTFAFLAPGPFLGMLAMLKLRSLPAVVKLAGGKQ